MIGKITYLTISYRTYYNIIIIPSLLRSIKKF